MAHTVIDLSAEHHRIRGSAAGQAYAGSAGSLLRKLCVALILGAPHGVPLRFVGIEQYQSAQLQQLVILGLVALGLLRTIRVRAITPWEFIALGFVLYLYLVSFLSNTFLIPQPLDAWLPGLLTVTPLLLVIALFRLGFSSRDAIDGLLIAVVFCGLLLNIDRFYRLDFLSEFVAYNSRYGSGRRIVLLHNEMAFGMTVFAARLLSVKWSLRSAGALAGVAVLFAPLFLVSESRLAIAAALLGISLYFIFFFEHPMKVLHLTWFGTLLLVLSPLYVPILAYYYDTATNLTGDASVQFRNFEIDYFGKQFSRTGGIGFGLMSLSPGKETVLSVALYRDAALFGAVGYWMSLVDIRIYAALFQFGYLGLAMVVALTIAVAAGLWRNSRTAPPELGSDLGAICATIFALTISPLPINLFTVENTLTLGGLLIFLVARSRTGS